LFHADGQTHRQTDIRADRHTGTQTNEEGDRDKVRQI